MTVKELLDKTDWLYIAQEMTRRFGEDLERGEAYTAEALEHMLSLKPVDGSENLIVCAQYREWFPYADGPKYMDTTMYKKAELLAGKEGHGYAYDMISWPRILGTEVAQTSINLYGVTECALAIYHEMTFFGCWKDQWEANIRELEEKIAADDCHLEKQAYPVADLWEGIDFQDPEFDCMEEEQRSRILGENRAVLTGILDKERERC